MKKYLLLTLIGLLLTTLSGCMSWTGGISEASTPLEERSYTVLGESKGTDSAWYLFSWLPITTSASTKVARDRCIRKLGGDALIDITADSYYYFYFIISRNATVVQGKVIKFTNESTNQ